MAKKKKRAAAWARRVKAARKVRKIPKSAVGKKTAKRKVTKAKSKRVVSKTMASKGKRPPKQLREATTETFIVDVIEEPVPGVVVVTEFETTEMRQPNASPEQPEDSGGAAPPELKKP